jgi:hypothetical protein
VWQVKRNFWTFLFVNSLGLVYTGLFCNGKYYRVLFLNYYSNSCLIQQRIYENYEYESQKLYYTDMFFYDLFIFFAVHPKFLRSMRHNFWIGVSCFFF